MGGSRSLLQQATAFTQSQPILEDQKHEGTRRAESLPQLVGDGEAAVDERKADILSALTHVSSAQPSSRVRSRVRSGTVSRSRSRAGSSKGSDRTLAAGSRRGSRMSLAPPGIAMALSDFMQDGSELDDHQGQPDEQEQPDQGGLEHPKRRTRSRIRSRVRKRRQYLEASQPPPSQ